jgi:putative transposase
MKEYPWRTGRSCLYKNIANLVLITKYRQKALSNEMLIRVEEIVKETCIQMDSELIEFNGEGDHIHLLVNIHPKYAVSNFVGKIKGKSSYYLRKEFWSEIKAKLWGKHFWSPSYCVVSVGGAPIATVKRYIENQRRPTPEKHVKKSFAMKKI